eukprot:COSAG01_NODE_68485_length_264_cov_0.612121_1_plen_60_part_01
MIGQGGGSKRRRRRRIRRNLRQRAVRQRQAGDDDGDIIGSGPLWHCYRSPLLYLSIIYLY